MESLRDLRKNIKSIKSTRQIMQTMKMISSARIKPAEAAMQASRPYSQKMADRIANIQEDLLAAPEDIKTPWLKALTFKRKNPDTKILVFVTADKGLCGAFNSNLYKAATQWLLDNREYNIKVYVVGRKGRDFLRRINIPNMGIAGELVGIFPKANYAHASIIGRPMAETFVKQNVHSITLIYTQYETKLKQTAVTQIFLPLELRENKITAKNKRVPNRIYEPDKMTFFEAIIPRFLQAELFKVLLESQAAELVARMNAMEAASKNATEIIDDLTLRLNRTRQSSITNEIIEIISGAQALSS